MSMAIGGGAGLGAGTAMNTGAAGPFAGVKGPQAAKATKELQAKNLQGRDPKAAKGQQLAKGPQGPGANDKPRDLNRTQAKDLKDPAKIQTKDQSKLQGADFGRSGALSRGQGFSQRDSFEAAEKKGQPGSQGASRSQERTQERTQDPQNKVTSQDMPRQNQIKEPRQADETKRAKEADEAQIIRMMQEARDAALMRMASMGPGDEELKETLKKMWKKFLEWLKEMDEIFLKPAPR